MPPKLPIVSGAETIRALERLGFVYVRQRGSHVTMKKQTPEREITCIVPVHRKPVPVGTLRNILRQAYVTP